MVKARDKSLKKPVPTAFLYDEFATAFEVLPK